MTHIPMEAVTQEEATKLLNIEELLKQMVIGQDFAIKQISSALKRARAGMRDEKKPIASFLFVGTTGVGKTQTAKALAKNYFGDAKNNVTHSLMFACSKLGIKMSVACPRNMQPLFRINGVEVTQDVNKAIKNADIVYVDSWMSYQISKSKHAKRVKQLRKYQVNVNLMKKSPKALFMHCLPAKRGEEVTSEVMDSNKSIVFDQAENRLHIQKAILLKLLC